MRAVRPFSAATVIVGLAGFSRQANAPLLTAAVSTYLFVAAASVYALWLTKFRLTGSPMQLVERYWDGPLDQTRYAMVLDMAGGFAENERTLRRKRRGVVWSLALTGLQTALVGSAVIWALLV